MPKALSAYLTASPAASGPLSDSLGHALRAIRSHLAMDVAFVSEFADGRRIFRAVDAHEASPIRVGDSDPLEESYCQHVVDGRLPELIPDTVDVPETRAFRVTKALPVGAHLSVPIRLRDGRLFGTFCCFSFTPDRSLNRRDLELMRAFADLAADQIEMIGGLTQSLDDTSQALRSTKAELRDSNDRYRLVTLATNDVIWDWDLTSGRVEWNEAVQSHFGFKAHEVKPSRRWWCERIHPDDRKRVTAQIQAVMEGGEAHYKGEYRFRRADGTYANVLDRAYVMRDPQGRAVRMVGALQDISERSRHQATAASLRHVEGLLYTILENIPAMVFVKDHEHRFVLANKATEDLTGISRDELIGKTDFDFFPEEQADYFTSADRQVMASGQMRAIEQEPIQTRGNGVRLLQTRKIPLLGRGGTAKYLLGFSADVTDRIQAEERLKAANETLQALIDASPIAIISLTPDLMIETWNRAAEAFFGYSAAEVIGRPYSILVPEERLDAHHALMGRLFAGEVLRGQRDKRRRKDGELVEVNASGAGVFGSDGKLRSIVVTLEDVTERKRLEEQLRQSQKMEAMGQLTGGIAHDFNNLLTVIIGNSELLADDLTDPQVRALAQMIREAAEKGADLTRHLLAFGRRQTLKPERVSLDQVVASMEPLLRRTITETIEIVTELQEGHSVALTDRTLLESAILNLVVNAKDAMPDGGILTIRTGERFATLKDGNIPAGQPIVFVTVDDTGTGIAPEVLMHVFEPFYTTKEVGKGTGLGLSMVYGFAQQAGGHASIKSQVGKGTSVTILLPAVDKQALQPSQAAGRPARAEGGERVLVVEDDPQIRHFVCAQLVNLGYRVEAVSAGPDALDVLRTDPGVDLLFTDVVLPKGISGLELAERARQIEPDLKVLLTSGYAEVAFQQHGRPEEDMPLLRKPYRRQELARMLRKVLESGNS